MKAYVLWYDRTAGEGMAVIRSGEHLYLHASCIWGIRGVGAKPYPDRNITGYDLDISVYQNIYSRRVGRAKLGRTKRNAKAWFRAKFRRCKCCDSPLSLKVAK